MQLLGGEAAEIAGDEEAASTGPRG